MVQLIRLIKVHVTAAGVTNSLSSLKLRERYVIRVQRDLTHTARL